MQRWLGLASVWCARAHTARVGATCGGGPVFRSLRALLWIDCCAGAVVGCVGLALTIGGVLSSLTGFPDWLLVLVGSANLLYAVSAFCIASASRPNARAVRLLALANAAWSLVCVCIVCIFFGTATLLGVGYLMAEAAFVACLASLELRALRAYLATP